MTQQLRNHLFVFDGASQLANLARSPEPRQGRSICTLPPTIGDIVDLAGRERGIVMQVRRTHDGSWNHWAASWYLAHRSPAQTYLWLVCTHLHRQYNAGGTLL